MTLIAISRYGSVDFHWVDNHYDLHLSGLCFHNGKLCRFETDYDTHEVFIFSLNYFEKIKWKIRKRLFEIFVSKNWSYPLGVAYPQRTPKWFWDFMTSFYYKFIRRIFGAQQ